MTDCIFPGCTKGKDHDGGHSPGAQPISVQPDKPKLTAVFRNGEWAVLLNGRRIDQFLAPGGIRVEAGSDNSFPTCDVWLKLAPGVEVNLDLGPGVSITFEDSRRPKITTVDDGRGIDVSTPWWEVCESKVYCMKHLDHTYVDGVRYGRKGAGT